MSEPLFRMVHGRREQIPDEEADAIRAEWAANAANPVLPVPLTVTRFQMHEALRDTPSPVQGFNSAYEAITALMDQIGGRTKRAFLEAGTFDRGSPSVNGAADHFGKDQAWVDDLFRRAGAISA